MSSTNSHTRVGVLAVLVVSLSALASPVRAALPGSRIFDHFVGREIVTSAGDLEAVGYYAFLDGIPGSFFAGAPSEATAFFTFRSSPQVFSDVFVNGSIAWATLQAGSTLSVYFNVSPHGDWRNPDSFSSGQLIATFKRAEGFFSCNGDLTLLNTCGNVFSGKLASSADFTFNGKTLNFNRFVPLGLTNVTPMIDTSFPGFAAVFIGYDLAIGQPEDQNGD